MKSSKSELLRLEFLKAQVERGEISNLQTQIKFKILDEFNTPYTLEVHENKSKFKIVNTRRARVYTADFTYKLNALNIYVIEEFKSYYTRTRLGEAYKIRRHILEQLICAHNITKDGLEFAKNHTVCFLENENIALSASAVACALELKLQC